MGRSQAEVERALRTRREVGPPPGELRLSVVVPAYKEADGIGDAVERIRAELGDAVGEGDLEVVVVDDGSGDGTAAAARAAHADQVLELPRNRGKGAAVRAGMLAAKGRARVFTDADLSYAPAQVERLLVALEDGWDVVVGNRYDPASITVVEAGLVRRIGGRVINGATRGVLVGSHPDTQCGLKGLRSDVAEAVFRHTQLDGFAFDIEVIHLVERWGLSMLEVEVEVVNSDRSTVHVASDALRLLADLGRIRRLGRTGAYELSAEEREALGLDGRPAGPSGRGD